MSLLRSYGLSMKVERGNRVFPFTDKSSDVIKVFEKFLADKNVNILLNRNVEDVNKDNESFIVKLQDGNVLRFKKN